eukprot:COSAG02_NODE_11124_length_1788_cov_48.043455_2_plen_190_part_00
MCWVLRLTEACCSRAKDRSAAAMPPLRFHLRPVALRPIAASALGSLAQASQSDLSALDAIVQPMRGCVEFACAVSHPDLAAKVAPAVLITQYLTKVLIRFSLASPLSSAAHAFGSPSFAWATIHHLTLQTRMLGTASASSEASTRAAVPTLHFAHLQCLALVHSPVAQVSAGRWQVYLSSPLYSDFAFH